jgi:hypothetical protein
LPRAAIPIAQLPENAPPGFQVDALGVELHASKAGPAGATDRRNGFLPAPAPDSGMSVTDLPALRCCPWRMGGPAKNADVFR